MKLLKDWTSFEKLLLFAGIGIVSLLAIIFRSDLLTTLCSISGIITALLIAKGKNLGQAFGILSTVVYSIVSFKNKFYGEVIIYLFIMLPMYILGIISWIKHQNKDTNTVDLNNIHFKEWIFLIISSIISFIGLYFLLRYFKTEELIVSTISVVSSLCAIYLLIRRNKYSFYFYIANDIILFILWGIPVLLGNLLLLPMVINPIINFINDSYGIYNWKKLEDKQKTR